MSFLTRLLAWFGKAMPSRPRTSHPDCLSVQDWADLPPHHPRCDPC
ncbi:MAG: hypothetical protein RLW68_05295 [Devosia marina]